MINDGDVVFLDGGTTILEIAKEIHKRNLKITIITISLHVAEIINRCANTEVIFLGGLLHKEEDITSGVMCLNNLKIFHAQKAIIGVASITESNGITDYSFDATMIKRQMIDQSDTSIFVADYSKFNKGVIYTVAELDDVDIIITASNTCDADIQMCQNHGIDVIIAPIE